MSARIPYAAYERLSGAQRTSTLKRLRKLRPDNERPAAASRVTDVRIFGSAARGESSASSDVAQFELDLELILECPVSVVSSGVLDPASGTHTFEDAVAR